METIMRQFIREVLGEASVLEAKGDYAQLFNLLYNDGSLPSAIIRILADAEHPMGHCYFHGPKDYFHSDPDVRCTECDLVYISSMMAKEVDRGND